MIRKSFALIALASVVLMVGVSRGDDVPLRSPPPTIAFHPIDFTRGDVHLAAGDDIVIEQVFCTADKLGAAEVCIVRGRYTLASREEATLGLHTTSSVVPRGPVDARQTQLIHKGNGRFELRTILVTGQPHVSFYPAPHGSSFGGVYFANNDGSGS